MTAFKNQLKTILLLGALSALVVGIGAMVAPGYLYLFAVLALAMNLGAYYFSDRIVLRMHRASEVSPAEAPQLHAMVEELSARAGIPKPRVFVIPEDQPNAFATGRNPHHGVVAVTEGIVRLLDRRELSRADSCSCRSLPPWCCYWSSRPPRRWPLLVDDRRTREERCHGLRGNQPSATNPWFWD